MADRYTLDEAVIELARRECAQYGHEPSDAIRTMSSAEALRYLCNCGAVAWVRQGKAGETDGE